MQTLRVAVAAALLAPILIPADLAISTYLKDGFAPSAIASDAQGNVYLAGAAVIDPISQAASAAVAKLDPKISGYVYLTYLGSAAGDSIAAMTVDAAGNVYVTGGTVNPNFPVVGTQLGSAPSAKTDSRSFVTKLDPRGAVVFSVLIGGDTASAGRGIALTSDRQILVSGIATASGFPTTNGAYTAADSKGQWYLMKLDAGGSKVIFSATGIGGSSLAVDSSGNIYMAGDGGANYPTTPGAYQTTFVPGYICGFPCQIAFPGSVQHVTKVDAAATKLLYSTGLNDLSGGAGSTSNTGLAVDASGNAYVTGRVEEGTYPFTVPGPANHNGYITFLSKLDPTGAQLLFSIPAGGAGVQIDSAGALYAGGFGIELRFLRVWIFAHCRFASGGACLGAETLLAGQYPRVCGRLCAEVGWRDRRCSRCAVDRWIGFVSNSDHVSSQWKGVDDGKRSDERCTDLTGRVRAG